MSAADRDGLTGPRGIDLVWDDISLSGAKSAIHPAILSINTQYNMNMASQVTVEVHDPDFSLARSNYFAIGRTVWYRGWTHSRLLNPVECFWASGSRLWQRFEVASSTVGPGPGSGAVWTLLLRPKGIQRLKRNRSLGTISGGGSTFIENAAKWAGLSYVVQSTSEANSPNSSQPEWQAEGNEKETAWDVMTRVASESSVKDEHTSCMMFEADNTLFFGTQRWLLGRWGMAYDDTQKVGLKTTGQKRTGMNYCYMGFPAAINAGGSLDVFRLMSLPRVTRSDNNPLEVTGSLQLDRFNARALRPGMTILLDMNRSERGTPFFNGYYLIDQVTFEHWGTSPVSITFRSPERIPKDINLAEVGDRYLGMDASENVARSFQL